MVRVKKSTNQKPISTVSKEPSGYKKRKLAKESAAAAEILRKQAALFFRPKESEPTAPLLEQPTILDETEKECHRTSPDCHADSKEKGSDSCKSLPSTTANVQTVAYDVQSIDEDVIIPTTGKEAPTNLIPEEDFEVGKEDSNNESDFTGFDVHDPATWEKPLSVYDMRKIFSATFSRTNMFPSFKFPSINGHRFNSSNFLGTKPNGEVFYRDWMRYSITSNSLFCVACCVYDQRDHGKSKWTNFGKGNTGFQDFKHCKERIMKHEVSIIHTDCMRLMKMFQNNSEDEKSILKSTITSQNVNVRQWRLVLRGILDAILYLAKNNLALQGHIHKIDDAHSGNFLNLIMLLSKYYPPLEQHVKTLKKGSVNYLSPNIQNEFIEICGLAVRRKIINKVKERKYFSMSFDSTPDVSHQDQFSQVIRTVNCSTSGCFIEESFIDFIKTTEKTGLGLSEVILKKLECDGLELQNCKGQSYDNGANMAGAYSGVQKRILDKNPEAKFVPCIAHSLNLVGVNAAEKVLEAKLILGKVQSIYVFFSCSTVKWNLLTSKLKKTLKCQSTTRWSAVYEAVSALWGQYGDLIELLEEMAASDDLSSEICSDAESKLRDLHSFKFLLGLTIWNQILFQINLANMYFQGKQVDIEQCKLRLAVLKQWLENFRESGFTTSLLEAESMAEAWNIEKTAGFENVRRGRGRNRRYMDREQFELATNQTNLERFEVEFFDKLIETLITEFDKRFHALALFSELFGFLWGDKLANMDEKSSMEAVKKLCLEYPSDLEATSFCNEMKSFRLTITAFKNGDISQLGPLDALNILYKNQLESSYINCGIALRIFLTLPVSVATNERSFSKLKIIKNYLRSTMGQERLTNLALMSIERDVTDKIDFEKIIDDFATRKCRRVPLV